MEPRSFAASLRTAAAWLGLAAALALVWIVRDALLVVFAAYLFSLLLRLMTGAICRAAPVSRGVGLLVSVAALAGLVLLCFWLFGSSIAAQMDAIMRQAKQGVTEIHARMAKSGLRPPSLSDGLSMVDGAIPGFLTMSLAMAETAVVVAVMAIYLAAEPGVYRSGAAALFPRRVRAKGDEALSFIAASLRLWLMGQIAIMGLVAVLTYLGLLVIGVPNAFALGLIAGLLEFVPYLGPFLAAAPAVLIALTRGPATAAWTILIYLAVHLFEGYLVAPLLQRWFVRIPPALILSSIIASQLVFGVGGVMLAAPLAVAIFAGVKVLYIRDTLHEPADLPLKSPL
ncbi:MAG TPA: AI-2E family transporter, partial [Rhizomicrobium sp.]|jgi:predicted PurR-regulated permease PerM|nr:AI-2E family transporter [Rhizomicrobium sp.]